MSARNLLFVLAFAAMGCTKTPPTADQVSEVAAISKELRANPENADKILSGHGLTEATFDALMYDIARDPARSKEYTAALGK